MVSKSKLINKFISQDHKQKLVEREKGIYTFFFVNILIIQKKYKGPFFYTFFIHNGQVSRYMFIYLYTFLSGKPKINPLNVL